MINIKSQKKASLEGLENNVVDFGQCWSFSHRLSAHQ